MGEAHSSVGVVLKRGDDSAEVKHLHNSQPALQGSEIKDDSQAPGWSKRLVWRCLVASLFQAWPCLTEQRTSADQEKRWSAKWYISCKGDYLLSKLLSKKVYMCLSFEKIVNFMNL